MEHEKLRTVLGILQYLSNNETMTVKHISERMEVSERSVHRTIVLLRKAGFDVKKESAGLYAVDTLNPCFLDMHKFVRFTADEAVLVDELLESVYIGNALRESLRRKIALAKGSAYTCGLSVYSGASEAVRGLREAMESRRKVILRGYVSMHTSSVSDRVVEPYAFSRDNADVIAYEESSGLCKTFKVTRIRDVELLEDRWENERFHRDVSPDAFRMEGHGKFHVKLQLSPGAKSLLLEEFPMAGRDVRRTSTGKWVLDTFVQQPQGIGRFVIGLADQIRVLDSPELVSYIRGYQKKIDMMIGLY